METSRTNQRTTKETPLNSANHGLKVWRLLKEQVTEIQVLRFVRLNAQLTLSNMELYADWQGPSRFFGIRDFKSKRWVRVITARDWKYARATSSPGRFFLALEFDAREAKCRRCRKQPSGYTVTLDVSMKARPKGCIEIKFYKVAEVHLTTTTKKSSHKCCAVALCNNRSDNRKAWTFYLFPKDILLPKVRFSTFQFPPQVHLL